MLARRALADSGGKITMRRLNRREYPNTHRTLDWRQSRRRVLPADGGSGTFDTVGARSSSPAIRSSSISSLDAVRSTKPLSATLAADSHPRSSALSRKTRLMCRVAENEAMEDNVQDGYLLGKRRSIRQLQLPRTRRSSRSFARIQPRDLTDMFRAYQNADFSKGHPIATQVWFQRSQSRPSFSYQVVRRTSLHEALPRASSQRSGYVL